MSREDSPCSAQDPKSGGGAGGVRLDCNSRKVIASLPERGREWRLLGRWHSGGGSWHRGEWAGRGTRRSAASGEGLEELFDCRTMQSESPAPRYSE